MVRPGQLMTIARRITGALVILAALWLARWAITEALRDKGLVATFEWSLVFLVAGPTLVCGGIVWSGRSLRQIAAVGLLPFAGVFISLCIATWSDKDFRRLSIAMAGFALPNLLGAAFLWRSGASPPVTLPGEADDRGFYVTGGTLRPDAPCYVERQADRRLHEELERGEFCYVLTSRQMGKSSLMVRTALRLRQEGVAVAVLDLTAVGQNLSPEQWYEGLMGRLGRQLNLEEELEQFWETHGRLGPLQRWMAALEAVVFPRCPGQVVIFIDEIDVVRSLPFPTDEFFAAIRECYNRRSEDPEFARLTFCLLGVASPSHLIRDTRMTPFNIGRRIELADFTEEEAMPLALGFGAMASSPGSDARKVEKRTRELFHRVYYWTEGHPYLTQRLCQAVAGAHGGGQHARRLPSTSKASRGRERSLAPLRDPMHVDRLCEGLFLTPAARESDDNLLFVRERVLRSEADRGDLLDLYERVLSPRGLPWRSEQEDTTHRQDLVDVLRLSGLIRDRAGVLHVRNRIYGRVFGREWVAAHLPGNRLPRLWVAYKGALLRAVLCLLAGVGALWSLAFMAVTLRPKPTPGQIYGGLGDRHFKASRWREAIDAYSKAIAAGNHRWGVWAWRGDAYAELGDWKKAAADHTESIRRGAGHHENWYHTALLQLALGNVDAYRTLCARMLDQFRDEDDEDADAKMAWAFALGDHGAADLREVVTRAETAYSANDGDVAILHTLGALHYRQGRYEDARETLEQAARQQGPDADAYDWLFLAMTYHRLGRPRDAKRNLDQARIWLQQQKLSSPDGERKLDWDERLELKLLEREALGLLENRTEPRLDASGPVWRNP
jgi:tetratricopeptide (TPR) repeat protein